MKKTKPLTTLTAKNSVDKPLSHALIKLIVTASGHYRFIEIYHTPTRKLVFMQDDCYNEKEYYERRLEIPENITLNQIMHVIRQNAVKEGEKIGEETKLNQIKKILEIEPQRKYQLKES